MICQDDWEELLGQLDMLIHDRQAAMAQARSLQAHQDTMDEELENYVRELERIDREDVIVVEKSHQLQVRLWILNFLTLLNATV